ncbi:MAG TPA: hypothetical protein DCR21_03965 [Succinivibrionaceae bacterium]|nr:hypothetical protein [Succinivibrio sp.]HAR79967.1 hypothetical protein [Succinivibrionaceae bacterium]
MERIIYKALCFAAALVLVGCSANNANNGNKIGNEHVYSGSGMQVSKVASQMSDVLFATMLRDLEVTQKTDNPKKVVFPRVAVTSFVDTDTYEDAGYLGRQLGEVFIHELDRRGIPVFEFKITGNISVSKTGEFVFSRNWRKIAQRAMVHHVLAGTITRNRDGVVLVARVINMEDSSVTGSSTGFIPYSELPYCYRTAEKNCTLYGVASYSSADPASSKVKNSGDYYGGAQSTYAYNSKGSKATAQNSKTQSTSSSGSASSSKEKSPAQVINDNIHHSSSFNSRYYPKGAKVPSTSTGNYEEYLYKNGSPVKNFLGIGAQDPIIYPASSYQMKDQIVRDSHDASQYERFSR